MGSIFKKLVEFQGKCKGVTLDGENPHFKSRFCTLGNLVATVTPILSSVGLGFCHIINQKDKTISIETRVFDRDTERYLSSELFIEHNTNPQKLGSTLTYYKRYQLAGLLGIAEASDDDGNQAEQHAVEYKEKAAERATVSDFEDGIDWFLDPKKDKTAADLDEWYAGKLMAIDALEDSDRAKVERCYKQTRAMMVEEGKENKLEVDI